MSETLSRPPHQEFEQSQLEAVDGDNIFEANHYESAEEAVGSEKSTEEYNSDATIASGVHRIASALEGLGNGTSRHETASRAEQNNESMATEELGRKQLGKLGRLALRGLSKVVGAGARAVEAVQFRVDNTKDIFSATKNYVKSVPAEFKEEAAGFRADYARGKQENAERQERDHANVEAYTEVERQKAEHNAQEARAQLGGQAIENSGLFAELGNMWTARHNERKARRKAEKLKDKLSPKREAAQTESRVKRLKTGNREAVEYGRRKSKEQLIQDGNEALESRRKRREARKQAKESRK